MSRAPVFVISTVKVTMSFEPTFCVSPVFVIRTFAVQVDDATHGTPERLSVTSCCDADVSSLGTIRWYCVSTLIFTRDGLSISVRQKRIGDSFRLVLYTLKIFQYSSHITTSFQPLSLCLK